jgi:hypothetical protein
MTRIFVTLIAVVFCIQVTAQRKHAKMRMLKAPESTICYASAKNEFTSIEAPLKRNRAGRTKSANIEVTYIGFTTPARNAFQEAVDIWESLIESDVTIRVLAQWAPLAPGVLGSAGPGIYTSNFDGAPKLDVWYPVALAEKIAGEDLNPTTEYDIVATFNSNNTDWHFGLTGTNPPSEKYDLVSIVLHEIGHGLGITHGYTVSGPFGVISSSLQNMPVVYETNIVDGLDRNMVNFFTPPDVVLKLTMTSWGSEPSDLYYDAPGVLAANGNQKPRLYAPPEYSGGSSIAHLDDDEYPAGNINSLMTPFIGAAERILDPGPITMAILEEIGWKVTRFEHQQLHSTENGGPYHTVVKIKNDYGYDKSSVTLHYRTTGNSAYTNLTMTPTANADEYSADIPGSGVNTGYGYYISVEDNVNREYSLPGLHVQPGTAPAQKVYEFIAGQDLVPPTIMHSPIESVTIFDNKLELETGVYDDFGVDQMTIEWRINGVPQNDVLMTDISDDVDQKFAASLNFVTPLTVDDKIEYRLRAVDASSAANVAYAPTQSTFYEVKVVGFSEARDWYINDFNDGSAHEDFFGNGFDFAWYADQGFDMAIHTVHPYPIGGENGKHVDLIYNLKVPIRIAEKNAILKFDEVVLVEPGNEGAVWPEEDFYDYVIVEGSKDGGNTWIPLADGYDSRAQFDWYTLWNAQLSESNSLSLGWSTYFHPHSFNLRSKFAVGDEVVFRFRLYSDAFTYGWGWAIDNLNIQVDNTPPLIQHDHLDFVLTEPGSVDIVMKVSDLFGVEQIYIEYDRNFGDGTHEVANVVVDPENNVYTQAIDLAGLGVEVGDRFQYRIYAKDVNGNEVSYPKDGFFRAIVTSFDDKMNQLVTDFSSDNPNIYTNYYTRETLGVGSYHEGFATQHPHPLGQGMGTDRGSDFSFITAKPVEVNAENPTIIYEDIAIVEFDGDNVKDYVVVEGTKDGATWKQFNKPYASNAFDEWLPAYNGFAPIRPNLYRRHSLKMTGNGLFEDGDRIIIRFRLHSDSANTNWGWIVDNLSIQDPTLGLEPNTISLDTWPNPVIKSLNVSLELPSASQVSVEILSTHGQRLSAEQFSAPAGTLNHALEMSQWPAGFYVVRVQSDFGIAVKKIIKINSQN